MFVVHLGVVIKKQNNSESDISANNKYARYFILTLGTLSVVGGISLH